jgi:hypothetical protein
MKAWVKHFARDYYVVKYRRAWYSLWPTTWGEPSVDWSFPLLMKVNKSVLFTIDEARQLVHSLTLEKIDAHEARNFEVYRNAKAKAKNNLREAKARALSASMRKEP